MSHEEEPVCKESRIPHYGAVTVTDSVAPYIPILLRHKLNRQGRQEADRRTHKGETTLKGTEKAKSRPNMAARNSVMRHATFQGLASAENATANCLQVCAACGQRQGVASTDMGIEAVTQSLVAITLGNSLSEAAKGT